MARLTTLFPFLLLAFFSVSSASGRDSLDASGVSSERFCFSSAQTHQARPQSPVQQTPDFPDAGHTFEFRPGTLASRSSHGLRLLEKYASLRNIVVASQGCALTQIATLVQTLRSALHANRAALLPASPAQRRAPSLSPRSRSCSLPFKIRAGWSQRASLPGALRMMAGGEELVSGASAVDGALKADFSRAQVACPPLGTLGCWVEGVRIFAFGEGCGFRGLH